MTAQIADLYVYKNKILIIFGNYNQDISVITIVNLYSLKIKDQFEGIWPSISPLKNWIIFRMWFPVRIPGGYVVDDQYLLYNLRHNKYANRTHQARINQFNAGIIVYPGGQQETHVLSNIVKISTPHHDMMSNGFYWLSNSRVAFADKYQHKINIIILGIHQNLNKNTTHTICLSCRHLINTTKCPGYSANAFAVQSIANIPQHINAIAVGLRSWPSYCLRESQTVLIHRQWQH